MRVYIAGPMRNIPSFNFPAFDVAAEVWRAHGHEVVSPAELDRAMGFDPDKDEATPEFMQGAMRRDVDAILSVDAVVVIDGWQDSTGTRAEIALARWRGIPVLDWRTQEEPEDAPVTEEATRLVYGERRKSYGHPHDDYSRVVGAFNALTGHTLTAAQGVIFMLCVKLAREAHKPKRDNRVDGCGYFACLDLVQSKEGGA